MEENNLPAVFCERGYRSKEDCYLYGSESCLNCDSLIPKSEELSEEEKALRTKAIEDRISSLKEKLFAQQILCKTTENDLAKQKNQLSKIAQDYNRYVDLLETKKIIKRCPLCGSWDVDFYDTWDDYTNSVDSYVFECNGCGTEFNIYVETKEEALKIWSKRDFE